MLLKSNATPRAIDQRALWMTIRQALIMILCELDRQLGLESCVVTKPDRLAFEAWKRDREHAQRTRNEG